MKQTKQNVEIITGRSYVALFACVVLCLNFWFEHEESNVRNLSNVVDSTNTANGSNVRKFIQSMSTIQRGNYSDLSLSSNTSAHLRHYLMKSNEQEVPKPEFCLRNRRAIKVDADLCRMALITLIVLNAGQRRQPVIAIDVGVQPDTFLLLANGALTLRPKEAVLMELHAKTAAHISLTQLQKVDVQYFGFLPDPSELMRMMKLLHSKVSGDRLTGFHLSGHGLSNSTTSMKFPSGKGVSASSVSNGKSGPTDDNSTFAANMENAYAAITRVLAFTGAKRITLFQINCEGCEYTVLPFLLDQGPNFMKSIDLITVQYHGLKKHHSKPENFWEIKCDNERRLYDTHNPAFIKDFVWEGWVSKALIN